MGIEIEVTASDQWKNQENFINPTKGKNGEKKNRNVGGKTLVKVKKKKSKNIRDCKKLQTKLNYLKMRSIRTSLVVQWMEIRGHGFNPWSGKIPHATEQLSPRTTTTEAAV